MKEIAVSEYETDAGNWGWRVCAPAIPGCVVIHRDPAHATTLVREAVIAINAEPKLTDVSDELFRLSHRSV